MHVPAVDMVLARWMDYTELAGTGHYIRSIIVPHTEPLLAFDRRVGRVYWVVDIPKSRDLEMRSVVPIQHLFDPMVRIFLC